MNNNLFSSYYGAANGFTGFRSYFKDIFNPADYTRIYVLKGGPGTGKSTIMKKILSSFKGPNYELEAVYCSSDPKSLDGVIIKNSSKKIAVLDGTAPHETDAKIPGAVDEVINLGEMWKRDVLIENREKILTLNQNKTKAYKKAYEYLSLAGEFSKRIYLITKKAYTGDFQSNLKEIMFDIPDKIQGRKEFKGLLSSFSKYGYKRLNTNNIVCEKCISIDGRFSSEYVFMNYLKNEVERKNTDYCLFPSPYSDDLIEAIYLRETKTFIIANDAAFQNKINTSDFLNNSIIREYEEQLTYYSQQFDELLLRAKSEFLNASDFHFGLEAIYTPAMNFEKINHTTDKLIADISKLI